MGPFLADRISGGFGYWLCGVAIAASAVSIATTSAEAPAESRAPVWSKNYACKQARTADPRKVLSVGPMLEAGSYRDIMRDTIHAELTRKSPWRIELTEAPSGGFFVDGTVDEMKVEPTADGTSRVYCELKLWVRSADRPISLISGAAKVDTTRGARDIALSRQACVTTVAEELVARMLGGDPWE